MSDNKRHVIAYRAADGRTVHLEVPWEEFQSDMIPPPMIEFWDEVGIVQFVHVYEADAS